jgi:hypothetical protein
MPTSPDLILATSYPLYSVLQSEERDEILAPCIPWTALRSMHSLNPWVTHCFFLRNKLSHPPCPCNYNSSNRSSLDGSFPWEAFHDFSSLEQALFFLMRFHSSLNFLKGASLNYNFNSLIARLFLPLTRWVTQEMIHLIYFFQHIDLELVHKNSLHGYLINEWKNELTNGKKEWISLSSCNVQLSDILTLNSLT